MMPDTKIRKLTIQGFRGIRRQLDLDFTDRFASLLVFGANAKGKSSIGDAFEWFFTGDIKELTKEGCSRDDYRHRLLDPAEDATVSFDLSTTDLSGQMALDSTRHQIYSNGSGAFGDYLGKSKKELLWLRHKDLKQFVDETKGEKRKQISHLIGMDDWERTRGEMVTVNNRLETMLHDREARLASRQREIVGLISAGEFDLEECWKFGEAQAQKLGLMSKIASLNDLKAVDDKAKEIAASTDRSANLNEIVNSEKVITSITGHKIQVGNLAAFSSYYNALCADPKKILAGQLDGLYQQGISILKSEYWDTDTCPLCEAKIDHSQLTKHIEAHQGESKEFLLEIEAFEQVRSSTKQDLDQATGLVAKINSIKTKELSGLADVKGKAAVLALAIARANTAVGRQLSIKGYIDQKEIDITKELDDLKISAATLASEISGVKTKLNYSEVERQRIDAFQRISNLTSHLAALEPMEAEVTPLRAQVSLMAAFTSAFQKLRRDTMGEVLTAISDDVSRFFLSLHPDEGFDEIRLAFLPLEDGVEFHIYYKHEEITPPRRFLSESYLNGLGVCLFLATVRAFNTENKFVVLDDVINSFDSEHRSQLAKLLVDEFSDYQLIVLTHDSIWFDFFRRLANVGWIHRRITRWSYEDGIDMETSHATHLAECNAALAAGNVEVAAPKVRSFLESRLKELLAKVGGRVRFREGTANDERSSGELLSDLIRCLREGGFSLMLRISHLLSYLPPHLLSTMVAITVQQCQPD